MAVGRNEPTLPLGHSGTWVKRATFHRIASPVANPAGTPG